MYLMSLKDPSNSWFTNNLIELQKVKYNCKILWGNHFSSVHKHNLLKFVLCHSIAFFLSYWNRLFSEWMYPGSSFLFPSSASLSYRLPWILLPFCLSLEKQRKASLKEITTKHDKIKYNVRKQNPSHPGLTRYRIRGAFIHTLKVP